MKKENRTLEQKLGYSFKNEALLHNALRHSSFVNEQPDTSLQDNERLEFLGDAVLSLTVGHLLMMRYPDLKEGSLSKMRANLVNESQLAGIAGDIDLGSFIQLGKGECQTDGRRKHSILADTFEAVIAAVYLDSDYNTSFKIVEKHFTPLLTTLSFSTATTDYKSRLQELVQEKHKVTPVYEVIGETGPDHDKTFEVQLTVCELTARGTGKSKKTAEQTAARKALEMLQKE